MSVGRYRAAPCGSAGGLVCAFMARPLAICCVGFERDQLGRNGVPIDADRQVGERPQQFGGEDQFHHHVLVAGAVYTWDGENYPPVRSQSIDPGYAVAVQIVGLIQQAVVIAHDVTARFSSASTSVTTNVGPSPSNIQASASLISSR